MESRACWFILGAWQQSFDSERGNRLPIQESMNCSLSDILFRLDLWDGDVTLFTDKLFWGATALTSRLRVPGNCLRRLWYDNFYRGYAGLRSDSARLIWLQVGWLSGGWVITDLIIAEVLRILTLGHDFLKSSGCGCLRLRLLIHWLLSGLWAFVWVARSSSEVFLWNHVLRSSTLRVLVVIHQQRHPSQVEAIGFQRGQSLKDLWRQSVARRINRRVLFG